MCLKEFFQNLFGGTTMPEIFTSNTALITIGVNDYPGSSNDLNGCLYDQNNAIGTVSKIKPALQYHKFSDAEATRARFKGELKEALKQQWDTVIFIMDCCFAEDNTRAIHDVKNRFIKPRGVFRKGNVKKHILRNDNMWWLAFSGSQSDQTSADAFIGGHHTGAFTYFAMKCLKPEMTYKDWFLMTKTLLAESNFEQIPELQGPEEQQNKKVFSDRTLIIHYSGHGTYTPDRSGDEADGVDEALYLYDGMLIDDELAEIMRTI